MAQDTPPRASSTLRREQSYEEANVWAPRRSPTGRIFVGSDGHFPADGTGNSTSHNDSSEGSSNESTPRSRDSQHEDQERSFGRFGSGERHVRSRGHGSGIGSVYIAGTPDGTDGGEVVFALARGVATVVTLSALALVMVLLIIAEAVLMVVAEKIGLAPVVVLVLAIMFVVGRQMGVPFQSLARVLVFLWAF
jgi:hypothetical protein